MRGVALYLIAIGAIQGATPSSLAATVLTARLAVAAFALVLAPVGAFLSRLALVGLLVLALVALTVFEANGSQRRAGDAEEPAP